MSCAPIEYLNGVPDIGKPSAIVFTDFEASPSRFVGKSFRATDPALGSCWGDSGRIAEGSPLDQ